MLTAVRTWMPASSRSSTSSKRFSCRLPGHVRVRQLVDDADLRLARDDRVDVHLLHRHAAVLDRAQRHDLEIFHLRLGVRAAVGLDDADDDVEAAGAERVRLLQHRVGLADARRRADVDAQAGAVLFLQAGEQGIG